MYVVDFPHNFTKDQKKTFKITCEGKFIKNEYNKIIKS